MQTHGIVETENLKAQIEKSSEKEKKVMECEFCDRKFKYKKSFSHHMHTEHGMSDDSDVPLSAYIIKGKEPKETEDKNITEDENSANPQKQATEENNEDDLPDDFEMLLPKTNRKVHTCHVCDTSFNRANHLTRHMTLHRSLLIYKCDRCDKAFAMSDYLEKHMQQDHIDKPYTCTICNKAFSRGEHLIRHLKLHDSNGKNTGENLKCSICERVFDR